MTKIFAIIACSLFFIFSDCIAAESAYISNIQGAEVYTQPSLKSATIDYLEFGHKIAIVQWNIPSTGADRASYWTKVTYINWENDETTGFIQTFHLTKRLNGKVYQINENLAPAVRLLLQQDNRFVLLLNFCHLTKTTIGHWKRNDDTLTLYLSPKDHQRLKSWIPSGTLTFIFMADGDLKFTGEDVYACTLSKQNSILKKE